MSTCDIAIVGSGPNGLVAGTLLAKAGFAVELYEAASVPGGGCRSSALTLPGFVHDDCAAIHPMGILSPAFRELHLAQHGLTWCAPEIPLAHPLPDGRVAVLRRSLERTCEGLAGDGRAWGKIFAPFSDAEFLELLLKPIWYPPRKRLMKLARFGMLGLRSCQTLVDGHFKDPMARALFAGCAAHSVLPLDSPGTASFGLVLAAVAHAVDWPAAKGGSQEIISSLVRAFESHGGKLHLGRRITHLDEVGAARAVVFDLSPRQVAQIAGHALPWSYRKRLERFKVGSGIFKVDWALNGPIPWRNEECRKATTVHVAGDYEEVLASEATFARGHTAERPFVLVTQQSLVDASRAPEGQHTGWAYCHVPNGSTEDMTGRIEAQIERFAPGFRDCILARHTRNSMELQAHNETMHGGDIGGGANVITQFLFRPMLKWNPYTTPNPRLFLCSSSTPPGGGVHGMCGLHAAHAVLGKLGAR